MFFQNNVWSLLFIKYHFQIQIKHRIYDYKTISLCVMTCVCVVQCVSGGGWRGASAAFTESCRDSAVLSNPHPLPERIRAELSVLLHSRVPCRPDSKPTALHRGRQPHVWRLLEPSAAASQELQHLLSGGQHGQRGERSNYTIRRTTAEFKTHRNNTITEFCSPHT